MRLIINDEDLKIPLTEIVTNHFKTHRYGGHKNDNNNDTLKLWIKDFNLFSISRQLREMDVFDTYYTLALGLSGTNYIMTQNSMEGIGCLTQKIIYAMPSNSSSSPTYNSWPDTSNIFYFYIGEKGIKFELILNNDNSISLIPKISTVKGYVHQRNDYFRNSSYNAKNHGLIQSTPQFTEGDIYLNKFYEGEGTAYNCGTIRKALNKTRDFINRMSTCNIIEIEFDNKYVSISKYAPKYMLPKTITRDRNNLAILELLENSVKPVI